jgi:hypothetical protein
MFKLEPKNLSQTLKDPQLNVKLEWGARKLMGENLKVVRVKFSTLSLAVLL